MTLKHIHREYFTSGDSGATKAAVADTDGEKSTVEVTLEGETVTLQVGAGQTILDVAQDAGVDVPFSCQGGVCSTCMAKVQEGTVKLEANFVLTDSELADGLTLTCQAHPTSDHVKITYDI